METYHLYEVVEETHPHPNSDDMEQPRYLTKILQIRLIQSKNGGVLGSAKIRLLNNVEEIINEEIRPRDTE